MVQSKSYILQQNLDFARLFWGPKPRSSKIYILIVKSISSEFLYRFHAINFALPDHIILITFDSHQSYGEYGPYQVNKSYDDVDVLTYSWVLKFRIQVLVPRFAMTYHTQSWCIWKTLCWKFEVRKIAHGLFTYLSFVTNILCPSSA